jgi:hypothetical protein
MNMRLSITSKENDENTFNVDLSLHYNTLSYLQVNWFLFLLLKVADLVCLAEN